MTQSGNPVSVSVSLAQCIAHFLQSGHGLSSNSYREQCVPNPCPEGSSFPFSCTNDTHIGLLSSLILNFLSLIYFKFIGRSRCMLARADNGR